MSSIEYSLFPRSDLDVDFWVLPELSSPLMDFFDIFDPLDLGRIENRLDWLVRPEWLSAIQQAERGRTRKYRIAVDIRGINKNSVKTHVSDDKKKLILTAKEGEIKSRDVDNYTLREIKRTYNLPQYAEVEKMASYMSPSGKLIIEIPIGHPPPKEAAKKPAETKEKGQEPAQQKEQESVPQKEQEPVQQKEEESVPQKEQEPVQQKEEESIPQKEQEPVQQKEEESIPQKEQEPVQQKEEESVPQKEQEPEEESVPQEQQQPESEKQPEKREAPEESEEEKQARQQIEVSKTTSEDIVPRIIDGNKVEMHVQIPGKVDASKVKVSLKDKDVIVMVRDEQENWDNLSETFYYKRSTLPDNTDFKSLKCTLEGNNLTIRAPLKEQADEGKGMGGAPRIEASESKESKTVA